MFLQELVTLQEEGFQPLLRQFDGCEFLVKHQHHHHNLSGPEGKKAYEAGIAKIKKFACVVRLIAIGQVKLLRIGQKKAHCMEIQINGGSIADKVEFGLKLFESSVHTLFFCENSRSSLKFFRTLRENS